MKLKNVLTTNATKTVKGEKLGYLTGILYLAPANTIAGVNLCPFASDGCKSSCLYTAGRGRFTSVQVARITKTRLFKEHREYFLDCLEYSINKVIRKAQRENMIPVIRLNGTSDIRWEHIRFNDGTNLFERFPSIQFYDYTKDYLRNEAFSGTWSNYHLTFSMSEINFKQSLNMLGRGVNVAIVFRKDLPEYYFDYTVLDGDETDLRFLDRKGNRGYVIGLYAKGDAKKDCSGFVQDTNMVFTQDKKRNVA